MLITARRLFTGTTDDVLEDHAVEIEDGRIVAVAPTDALSSGEPAVDLGDATLLPGLVDIHVHLGFDATLDAVANLMADDDATLLLRMRAAAQRALAVGITNLRDLGDRNYLALTLRDWYLEGNEIGPRILASGPPLTCVQGHCWFLGGEVADIEGIREAVRERAARGADVIKIMASGGNLTPTVGPHESQFGRAELAVALEEAHAAGLPLAVHAHGVQAVLDALDVGADSIEHCSLFTADGIDSSPEILERLARGSSVLSVTAASVARPTMPAIAKRIDAMYANAATVYRAGGRIVCSSDAGVAPPKPHTALPHGVSDFLTNALGMAPAEAIRNVTAVAADVLGLADRIGTIEVGKDADLLAVAGNPLENVAAIHDVVAVFARGQRVATG
jgi:imidazolonepropionase-like amidohydrolase